MAITVNLNSEAFLKSIESGVVSWVYSEIKSRMQTKIDGLVSGIISELQTEMEKELPDEIKARVLTALDMYSDSRKIDVSVSLENKAIKK